MPDAFIYDHVRTPRGRGKADGALHEVTALNLAAQTLAAIRDRNKLDTTRGDAAHHHVVDQPRIELIAVLDGAQRLRREIERGHLVQRAIGLAASARRAHMVVNESIRHRRSPAQV